MKVLSGGGFQYPNAVAVASGTLQLALSLDATVIGTGQIAPQVVTIALDVNGDVSGTPQVYGNDELSPEGTVYTAQVVDSNGARVYGPQLWSLAGSSPINLDNLQALLAEDVIVNFPSAVLLNPSQAQTITNFGLIVPSLTVNGNAVHGISLKVNGVAADSQTILDLTDSGNLVWEDDGAGVISGIVKGYFGIQAFLGAGAPIAVGPLNPGYPTALDYIVLVSYAGALVSPGTLSVTYTNGTHFSIVSSSATDASTIRYLVIAV